MVAAKFIDGPGAPAKGDRMADLFDYPPLRAVVSESASARGMAYSNSSRLGPSALLLIVIRALSPITRTQMVRVSVIRDRRGGWFRADALALASSQTAQGIFVSISSAISSRYPRSVTLVSNGGSPPTCLIAAP